MLLASGTTLAGAAWAQDRTVAPGRLPPGAVVQPLPSDDGEALRSHLNSLASNPRSVDALIGAGRAALEMGDHEAALTFFGRADELLPRNARIKAGIGSSLVHLGQAQTALTLFAEAASLGAPDVEIAADRGLAFDMVGEPRRAQQDYVVLLRRRDDPQVRRRLALSLAISGERDAALRAIDAQLRSNERAAWRTQAFVLALTGDVSGASRTAQTAMPPAAVQAITPFLTRLASLSPAQKAMAVHLGHFPTGRSGGPGGPVRADPGAVSLAMNDAPTGTRPSVGMADPPATASRRRPGSERPNDPSNLMRYSREPQPPRQQAEAPLTRPQAEPSPTRPQAEPSPTRPQAEPSPTRIAQAPDRWSGAATVAPRTERRSSLPPAAAVSPPQRALVVEAEPDRQLQDTIAAARQPAGSAPAPTGPTRSATAPTPSPTPSPSPSVSTPAEPAISSGAATPGPTPPGAQATTISSGRFAAASAPPATVSGLVGPIVRPTETLATSVAPSIAPQAQNPVPEGNSSLSLAGPLAIALPPSSVATSMTGNGAIGPGFSLSPSGPQPEAPADDENGNLADIAALIEALPREEPAAAAAAPPPRATPAPRRAEPRVARERAATPAHPARHWVQIAGGADRTALPREFSRLRALAPDQLGGRTAYSTPLRATNRLLVGPFRSEREAQLFVNQLAGRSITAFAWTSAAGQEIEILQTRR